YPNWTSRASSSGRVISSSFLIGGENFRMDVCPKQVHGLPDELRRVKNEVVADRPYFVLPDGAQRRHRCPNCCLILTKPASRRVHDIQDDLRIERHDGFFIDGHISGLGGCRYQSPARNLNQLGEKASRRRDSEFAKRSGSSINNGEHTAL